MSARHPDLVVIGQVMLTAAGGVARTEAIGIADGRVQLTGTREEVLAVARPRARVIEEPGSAVIPGLHDFHLHLVGMARMRREVRLDHLLGPELLEAIRTAAGQRPTTDWLRGRGWSEAAMTDHVVASLNDLLRHRPALVYSHDAHSAWASPGALERAGIGAGSADPAGGRIERGIDGTPSGLLRERATDMVEAVAGRLRGTDLDTALEEVVAELASWGVTGVTDAGDTSADNGVGEYAALGDRASLLLAAAPRLDGRLRLAVGFPAEAIEAAAELGLVTAAPLQTSTTLRAGWAKAYADGALGSRTAAIFEPYTCGDLSDTGILRLQPAEMDRLVRQARRSGIGLAVHAIGDRAAAEVLDALERGPRASGAPPDRLEHLQLLRPGDAARLAAIGATASMQPVHCAADRELVEACWSDRRELAYPWRSLMASGALIAFGSDAPIETPNPWHGVFAAVRRRLPGDGTPGWQTAEALMPAEALAAYTAAPARAAGLADEGHLAPGAQADLAVLNVDLETLLAADERLAGVRSLLTLVAGREVHRT